MTRTMKEMSASSSVDISRVILNARVFNPRNWQGGIVDAESLPQTVFQLFETLREKQIAYVLVGGVAMLHYVKGRNTEDLDFILDAEALEKIPQIEITGRDEYFARANFRGLRLDFLLTRHPLFRRIREKYSAQMSSQAGNIQCATVEGMLLLKLFALPDLYRKGDFDRVALYESDISMLMKTYRPALQPLFDELQPHMLASDLEESRKIIAEIQQRIERFEHGRREGQ